MRFLEILLFYTLQIVYGTLVISDSSTFDIYDDSYNLPILATAFIQTGDELRYFSGSKYHENLLVSVSLKSDESAPFTSDNRLQFTPTELDFGEQIIGASQVLQIFVHNPTTSKVRFDAISGATVYFHCSFPEQRILDAGESTKFDVVFLPLAEVDADSTVHVHTSLGTFTYMVRGKGIPNPYLLRRKIGALVPFNGSFVSPLTLHNPHSEVMHITEVFSSGDDIHLEMPENDSSLWELKPHETKTVINARILGAHERNGTGFIRIKADFTKSSGSSIGLENAAAGGGHRVQSSYTKTNEIIVNGLTVPVNYEITRRSGIFSTVSVLNFGMIRNGHRSSVKTLQIYSTLEKRIDIESIYVDGAVEPNAIYMEFVSKPPIGIKAEAKQRTPTPIAKILFDTNLLRLKDGEFGLVRYTGVIVAESRGGNYNISVPYSAFIYSGSITQRGDTTTFHTDEVPPILRCVTLTNSLPLNVAIWNVTLADNAHKSFQVQLLERVLTVGTDESKPVFLLKYIVKESDSFISNCYIHTNLTTFTVPIIVFNGRLRVRVNSIAQNEFNFGVIDSGDVRSIQFTVTNDNPVSVRLNRIRRAQSVSTTLRALSVDIRDAKVSNKVSSIDYSYRILAEQELNFELPSLSCTTFEYTLKMGSKNCDANHTLVIETEFEKLSLPVKCEFERGALTPFSNPLVFGNLFPTKRSYQTLQLHSSYDYDMILQKVSVLSNESRIYFEKSPGTDLPLIRSGQVTNIGRIFFIPSTTCGSNCYVGVSLNTSDGQWFTYGMRLPQNLAEIDYYLYKRLRRRYLALKDANKLKINDSVVVDTHKVRNFQVPVHGELIWPKLMTQSVVHFPFTAVGNFTIVNLTLTNPSSLPVVVQLLPLVIYPDAESLVEFFRSELPAPLFDPIEVNETLMFSLRDTELFTLKPDSPVPKLREQVERVVGTYIPKFTLSMLLQPGMRVRVRVGFLPSDYTVRSSLLLIRNNLTIIEPVVLYGRGARMNMEIENISTRSPKPLIFELQGHHLSDCHNPKRLMHKFGTALTVKRTFVVRNTGEVPFTVVNISINNIPCENRGFQIVNCHPFRLSPNETYAIDILHTSDFLISWNEAALQFYMHMNGTPWLFHIGASVPKQLLAKCYTALPRPAFEYVMYYLCITISVFGVICVTAFSYLEADRTIRAIMFNHFSRNRHRFEVFGSNLEINASMKKSDIKQYDIPLESNILVRLLMLASNGVAWLFSYLRRSGDDQSVTAINRNSKLRLRKSPMVKEPSLKGSNKCVQTAKETVAPNIPRATGLKKALLKLSNKLVIENGISKTAHTTESSTLHNLVHNTNSKLKFRVSTPDAESVPLKSNHIEFGRKSATSASEETSKNSVRDPSLCFVTQSSMIVPKGFGEKLKKNISSERENRKRSRNELIDQEVKVRSNLRTSTSSNKPISGRHAAASSSICRSQEKIAASKCENLSIRARGKAVGDVVHVSNDDRFSPLSSTDYRSDADFSDSEAPEWAEAPPLDGCAPNVDEEFNALVVASERLFDSPSLSLSKALSDTSDGSPSACSCACNTTHSLYQDSMAVPICSLPNPIDYSCDQIITSKNAILGSVWSPIETPSPFMYNADSYKYLYSSSKPIVKRPSPFIEQLQRERKEVEAKYMAQWRQEINDESAELWPGFNLSFSTLAPGLFSSSSEREGSSVWRIPEQKSIFPTKFNGQSIEDISKSIKAFRLNPEAPPFVIRSTTSKDPCNSRERTEMRKENASDRLDEGNGTIPLSMERFSPMPPLNDAVSNLTNVDVMDGNMSYFDDNVKSPSISWIESIIADSDSQTDDDNDQ